MQAESSLDPSPHEVDSYEEEVSATNLFVANLPPKATDDLLRSLFSNFGTIVSCKVMIDFATGRTRGFGFVKYSSPSEAQLAINSMSGVLLEGKTLTVKLANSLEPNQTATNNIYVKGLPLSYTQGDLEQLFAAYGRIIESRILNDIVTGLSRGIGFVRFETVEQACQAIAEMNNRVLPGTSRPLLVKFADTEQEKSLRRLKQQKRQRMPQYAMPSLYTAGTAAMVSPPYYGVPMSLPEPLRPDVVYAQQMNATLAYSAPVPVIANVPNTPTVGDESNIYVFNLPSDADDSLMYKIFSRYGAIQSVKVVRDPQTGVCRGFGFVRYAQFSDALRAIQATNGMTVGQKHLSVSFKSPHKSQHRPYQSDHQQTNVQQQ